MAQITGKPTGWFCFRIDGTTMPVWIDTQSGGQPEVLVLQNRQYTKGMRNMDPTAMVTKANYRIGTDSSPGRITSQTTLSDFNCFIAPRFWEFFGFRTNSSKIRVTQFVSNTVGTTLQNSGAHVQRARWTFDGWNTSWGFVGAGDYVLNVGNTTPGMYNYHAINGYGLSSTNGCANSYGGHPGWFGGCWSGNYFGSTSGSHQDRPYWSGSGGYHYAYGAIYVS
jgi:hypothetical protein